MLKIARLVLCAFIKCTANSSTRAGSSLPWPRPGTGEQEQGHTSGKGEEAKITPASSTEAAGRRHANIPEGTPTSIRPVLTAHMSHGHHTRNVGMRCGCGTVAPRIGTGGPKPSAPAPAGHLSPHAYTLLSLVTANVW